MRVLEIGERHRRAILAAARQAAPNECCGLIEGATTPRGWRAEEVWPTPNLADDPRRRFLIDPAHQFTHLRRLRGTARAIIGCFHSHAEGRPTPSATDLAEASLSCEDGFLWLIAAGGELAGFAFDAAASRFDAVGLEYPVVTGM